MTQDTWDESLKPKLELISIDRKELANEMLRQCNIHPYRIKKIPHKISTQIFFISFCNTLDRTTFYFVKKKKKKNEKKLQAKNT